MLTPATVLSTIPYGETSRIARLATRDQGVVSVIAKGARRPKSRPASIAGTGFPGPCRAASAPRASRVPRRRDLPRDRAQRGREARAAGAQQVDQVPEHRDPEHMTIKSDKWIRRMAEKGMIEPFEPGQVRHGGNGRLGR